jgi:hypothetical protein
VSSGAPAWWRGDLRRPQRHEVGTIRRQIRAFVGGSVEGMTTTATPWGKATVLEELRVAQRAGDRRFETVVQLLEDEKGGELIRFAYATGGVVRRGPVTLRGRDLHRLRQTIASRPRLAGALGLQAP